LPAPVDLEGARRHIDGPSGADRLDPTVLNEHGLILSIVLGVRRHRDDVHPDKSQRRGT
jgi:hypothetical protein